MPKRYPEEFRRKVLDLVAAGRPIAQIANDLNISDQTVYGWRRQELIDTGQLPGLNRAELAELSAVNRRIRELEIEVATLRSPLRLEQRARQLGLTVPARDQFRLAREYVTGTTGLAAAQKNRVEAALEESRPTPGTPTPSGRGS